MRARNLKPGFFQNEQLAELPIESRLLFAGLWCMADREGRLEDRPKKIKIQLFPADTIDVAPLLQQLADQRLIVRYEVAGAAYIWIPSFIRHQKPHHRELPSTIPPAPKAEPHPGTAWPKAEPHPGTAWPKAEPHPGTSQPALNPSSLNPSSLNPEYSSLRSELDPTAGSRRNGAQPARAGPSHASPASHRTGNPHEPERRRVAGNPREPEFGTGNPRKPERPPAAGNPCEPEFDRFRQTYPRRAGGDQRWQQARQAIAARLREGHTWPEILDAVRRYAAYVRALGKEGTEFVKQAASFVGKEAADNFRNPWQPPPTKAQAHQDRNIENSKRWLEKQETLDAEH